MRRAPNRDPANTAAAARITSAGRARATLWKSLTRRPVVCTFSCPAPRASKPFSGRIAAGRNRNTETKPTTMPTVISCPKSRIGMTGLVLSAAKPATVVAQENTHGMAILRSA